MVGAGFSRNAEPLAGVSSQFPTWRELVRAMFEQLHPATPDEKEIDKVTRENKFNGSSPLRIASEYEAALGRDKLDKIIRERNPDSDFQPGSLHRLLMGLPWADVFTTNYDTLLERTDVAGRNYQVVTKGEELPFTFSPRIVKLHGSFPSQTPFIVSEEDYRTYPRHFAPFVNTVQQALLENSFILVGFSGDDPNFLAWTGWIRDELNRNHAPIYLVGPLSLGNAERQLLNNRGVTPIDLAPLFQEMRPDEIHQKSIEWFLECLAGAKPARPDRWPEFQEPIILHRPGFPAIIGAIEKAPDEIPMAPNPQEPITNDLILKVVNRWRFERLNYPGWVILPHQKRTPLWNDTNYWIGALFHFTQNWPVAERILVYREINWRLETAMVPLFTDIMGPIEKTAAEAAAIFLGGQSIQITELIPDAQVADVMVAWLELMFGLLREARETYKEDRWNSLKSEVAKMVSKRPEFNDQLLYEDALWAMWNVRRNEAKAIVVNWQPSAGSLLACLRKAGLLAELDELGESRTILQKALTDARKALRAHGQNILLLSIEGWVTYLIFGVEQALSWANRTSTREMFWERWQELKAWDCSPWVQTEYFEQELGPNPPAIEPMTRETIGFDPGHISITTTYTGYFSSFFPAFACLRLYEQAGIPFRMQRVALLGNTLMNACNWIAPFIGWWSPAILVRAGNATALAKNSSYLTRTGVALMQPEVAIRLHNWCLNIFVKELASIGSAVTSESAQESIFSCLPEIMSRLAFKIPEADLRKSFEVAFKFHNLPAVRAHLSLNDICVPWFKRLFDAAEPKLLIEWLPILLKATLFENVIQPHWRRPDSNWPDPIDNFPWRRIAKRNTSNSVCAAAIREPVEWLLARAVSESGVPWRRAMVRLLTLSSWDLLTNEQAVKATQQVWSKRGANGLPDLINLNAFGYVLKFAPAPGIDATLIIKNYILSLKATTVTKESDGKRVLAPMDMWQQQFIRESIIVSKQLISFHGEALTGIEWTTGEANQFYEKALAWWELDKSVIQTEEQRKVTLPFGGNPVLTEAGHLDDFFSLVVLPYVQWPEAPSWNRFFEWLSELRSLGLYMDSCYPHILLQRPGDANRLATEMLHDLNSNIECAVAAAAEGVRYWSHLAANGRIPAIDPRLIDNYVQRIALRREERIEYCLSIFVHLLDELPQLFTLEHISLLVASLEPWNQSTLLTTTPIAQDGFPPAKRPTLRSRIGGLAGAIKRWHLKMASTTSIPEQVTAWESVCANDSLPEVRRSFNDWNTV